MPYVASQVVFMRPAATFVNYAYNIKITQQFRRSDITLIVIFHVRSVDQHKIMNVALCHKKVGYNCKHLNVAQLLSYLFVLAITFQANSAVCRWQIHALTRREKPESYTQQRPSYPNAVLNFRVSRQPYAL